MFTLICNPDDYMFNKYNWTHESGSLSNTGANITVTYANESSPETVGGDYTCIADGLVERSFQVSLAPHITSPPTDVHTVVGNDVVFNCEAVGFPTPNITWIYDGTTLNSTFNKTNSKIYSTLTISGISADNYGDYVCVTNTTSITATLIGMYKLLLCC